MRQPDRHGSFYNAKLFIVLELGPEFSFGGLRQWLTHFKCQADFGNDVGRDANYSYCKACTANIF